MLALNNKAHSLRLLSLFAFVLVLPLFEFPKTLFLAVFLASSVRRLWLDGRLFRFGLDDGLILGWMFSGYVVALFSGLKHKEWMGATGVLLLALLLLVVKKSAWHDQVKQRLGLALLISALLAMLHGFWRLWVTRELTAFELNSVGHVNHSSIYLVLSFALALAMTMVLKRNHPWTLKLFLLTCLAITTLATIITNSRATVMTLVVIAVLFGLAWFKRSKLPLLLFLGAVAVGAGGMYAAKAPIVQKHLDRTSSGPYLGERQAIWNSALLAWRQHPLFGLGIRNYAKADKDLQVEWLAREGKQFVVGEYLPYVHAHSLYLSLLAEQGLFGFSVTLVLLFRIAFLLYRHRPQTQDDDAYWWSWLAALGALATILVNGSFNTTLHHEHGLFAMLLIGLWWSSIDRRQEPLMSS